MTRHAARCGVGGPAAVRLLAVPRPLVVAVSLIVAVILVADRPAVSQTTAAPADSVAQLSLSVPSRARLVDRIVAIVDEEMILQSDLERELEIYRYEMELTGESPPANTPAVRDEILQRLIESKLIIAAAKQEELEVDDDAVRESVDEKIQQWIDHLGSRDALERELERTGMTLEDYRNRLFSQIRDQQYMRLVVGRFIRPKIEVLENEVEEYYYDHLAEMPQEPDSLTISNILIVIQPSAEVRQEVQNNVKLVQEALRQGQPFDQVAREYSRGPNAARGGNIGVVNKGDLFDPSLEQAVFALSVGEVSAPVVSSRGVHLIRLDRLTDDGRRDISQIYFPMEVTREDVDQAQLAIDRAYQRVSSGEAFSLVAAEMSGDPASARNGGLLGTFRLDDLSQDFQEILTDAQPGDITEPLLTPAGWYIFRVIDRIAGHSYTFEELKEQIRRQIEALKMEAELSEYVGELRTRFFVDVKL